MAKVEAGELWKHDKKGGEYVVLYDDVPGQIDGEWVSGIVYWLGPKKKRVPGQLFWRARDDFLAKFTRVVE
jgi:hypothetical protein